MTPRRAETVPVIQEIQKIVELPKVLVMDEVVGMLVVMRGKCVRLRRARKPGSCHRSSTSTRSFVFPWRCNIRSPQFQRDERQMLVIPMCSKTTRGAPTGPAR